MAKCGCGTSSSCNCIIVVESTASVELEIQGNGGLSPYAITGEIEGGSAADWFAVRWGCFEEELDETIEVVTVGYTYQHTSVSALFVGTETINMSAVTTDNMSIDIAVGQISRDYLLTVTLRVNSPDCSSSYFFAEDTYQITPINSFDNLTFNLIDSWDVESFNFNYSFIPEQNGFALIDLPMTCLMWEATLNWFEV